MTTTVIEFKCPACGHLIGEEEYELTNKKMDKIVQEISNTQIEKTKNEYEDKVREAESKANNRILKQEIRHKYELENRVNQIALLKIKEVQSKYEKEKAEIENKHLEEMEETKLQNYFEVEEKHQLHRLRIEQDNQRLLNQVEKLQKTLENVPPEYRGTDQEIVLFDDLHTAFPTDDIVSKKVGVEMGDVIQTVVENEQKINPPIVWDQKAGDIVSKKDIEKAKRYKTIHSTDFSIIVTYKGITKKDSNNSFIGTREGILLVHPKMVVEVSRLLRSFIIEMSKTIRNNDGKTSKQAKLYHYLTSPEYTRTMNIISDKKSKLDELQRKEEDYHKKTWNSRTKFIEEWSRADQYNQRIIDGILQDQTVKQTQDHMIGKEEDTKEEC